MKAISLWQPWASLIACGAKPFETRHWAPPASMIGQTIAIHAAKKIDKGAALFAQDLMYGQHPQGGFDLANRLDATMEGVADEMMGVFGQACMPIGCVVCTAKLAAAFQLGEPFDETGVAAVVERHMLSSPDVMRHAVPYDDFGDYAPGRWAWLLSEVNPLMPPRPVKGAQGFFNLPQGWMTA
jgi:hypothetical protein